MDGMSNFRKWFKAQFKGLPFSDKKRLKLTLERDKIEEELDVINRILEYDDRLIDYYKAASYTRNAAEKDFKF